MFIDIKIIKGSMFMLTEDEMSLIPLMAVIMLIVLNDNKIHILFTKKINARLSGWTFYFCVL